MRTAVGVVVGLLLVVGIWALLLRGGEDTAGRAPDAEPRPPAEDEGQPILKGQAVPSDAEARSPLPDKEETDRLSIAGRILNERRFPVAGAVVVTKSVDGEIDRAVSGEDGRFVIGRGARPTSPTWRWLEATANEGAARLLLYIKPDAAPQYDYGPIVLRPRRSLQIRVTHGGAAVSGAEVIVTDAESLLRVAELGRMRTDDHGVALLDGIVAERVRAFAWAPGYGRAVGECAMPRDGNPLELALPPDRTLRVHVRKAGSEVPVADAEVWIAGAGTSGIARGGSGCLPPLPPLRTDAAGNVAVSGLPEGHLTVVARAPGFALPSDGLQPRRVGAAPDQEEVTVELQPYRTLRFPIADGSAGAPPNGTELELKRYQPLPGYDEPGTAARVEDAHVVIDWFPPGGGWGRVEAPDGRWAEWRTKYRSNLGDPVVFHHPRDVDVRLRFTDGMPAVKTDSEGRAFFPACIGGSATVMWSPVAHGFGTPLARVDLQSPPGPTEVRLAKPVDLAIRIVVDGVPRLPATYTVRVPDTDPVRLRRPREVTDQEYEEDPDAAEIRFRWIPITEGEAPEVTVEAEGYPPATVVPARSDDGIWRGRAELAASAALLVRVDVSEGVRHYLKVERWDEEKQAFTWDPRDPALRSGAKVDEGVYRYEGLRPGRYRLREHFTGTTTAPFDLRPGAGMIEVPFDLTTVVEVAGRVVAPDGEEPAFARVRVRAADDDEPQEVRVNVDGGFTHRALRGQRLRFSVEHPVLQPAPIGGTVEIVAGGEGPVLHLVAAPQIAFRVEGFDYSTPKPDPRIVSVSAGGGGPVRVRLAAAGASDPQGAPSRVPLAENGRFRLAVPKAGTWTMSVFMQGHVPLVVPSVEVPAAGVKDLGTLTLSEGALLTIRLHSASGKTPPWLHTQATHLGEPAYTANAMRVESGDPPVVKVYGLGPGRFRVKVMSPPGPGAGTPALDREIDSDGSTPITLDLNLP
jgi:hypothetical protein